MPASPRHLALSAGLGLVAATLVTLPAPAHAIGPGLVISEVYGGGNQVGGDGVTSAVLQNDFVELHNTTTGPISLLGKSLQYRAAGSVGLASSVLPLPDADLPAGGKLLVRGLGGTDRGEPLPTPDVDWNLNLNTNTGQVFIADTADAIDPNEPAGASGSTFSAEVIDFLGWGGPATSFEGSQRAPGSSVVNSVARTADDTDNNGPDFTAGAPLPEACGCVGGPDVLGASIAEIQGTGAASPLLNDIVTTEGRVTATYTSGGLNGFYLQTGGTPDTPGASDAVFVSMGNLANNTYPALGDSVEVTGAVTEVGTATQITVAAAEDVVDLVSPLPEVTPLSAAWTDVDTTAEKEAHEGELLAPQGAFTVSGVSGLHSSAEIALAQGTRPLVQPTEVAAPGAGANTVTVENALKAITLDDGATTNYAPNTPNPPSQGVALPWLTGAPVRVGAAATFHQPLIMEFRSSSWRLQPTQRLTGNGAAVATFANTRSGNAAPQDVGGDATLATLNLQSYFVTTGDDFEGEGGGNTCTKAVDRDSNPITVSSCTPGGPAGAATSASLARQESKLVATINGLGASAVGLQELENSAKLGGDRDDAINALVAALNAAAGPGTWAAVPSPDAADRPALADEGLLRNGLIYRPAELALVGSSEVLVDEANFDNAAEPLAQTFKAVGAPDAEGFAVVVNQFAERTVSEGDRTGQASAAAAFASAFATEHGVDATFLVGDLNSYSKEAPLLTLAGAGFTAIHSDTDGEATFSTGGLSGSLDHVLGNAAAMPMVTGADVWDVNAGESAAYHYSRHNANVTNLVDAVSPFASSDRNPVLVGLGLSGPQVSDTEVSVTVSPAKIRAGSGKASLTVAVTASGADPEGTVRATVAGVTAAPVALSGGSAKLTVGPFTTAGNRTVTVAFSGATGFADSQDTAIVQVIKALPTMKVTKARGKVVVKKTRAKLTVAVAATGLKPTGKVTAKLGKRTLATGTLKSGKAIVKLPKFKRKGTFKVTVVYAGSSHVETITKTIRVKVRR